MFTGIITGIGHIREIEELGDERLARASQNAYGKRLTIQAPVGYLEDVALGDSIALQGACMTVTSLNLESHTFTIDISRESLSKTSGLDQLGAALNLEKALRLGDYLGGHLVSGHVDGVGHVARFAAVGESWELVIACPCVLAPYLVYKGSITVNGVSLTINDVKDQSDACNVGINLIPHTLSHTTLGQLHVGDAVNLEIDTIARYVQRIVALQSAIKI